MAMAGFEIIPIANFLFVWTNAVGAARRLNSSSGVGSGYVAYTASPKSPGVVSYQAILRINDLRGFEYMQFLQLHPPLASDEALSSAIAPSTATLDIVCIAL
ncbi:2313_t:CDS:2, partial [Ambispora gerdemannii]